MIRSVGHADWQVLRALARATGPLSGRALRLTPNRRTADGTFLGALVGAGLIEPTGDPVPEAVRVPGSQRPAEPVPFRTLYQLTERGRHAAEYGEYEYDFDAARKAAREAVPA
ncbi:MAG TPA: hypothetical protein VGE74_24230 [Gemmata sp.]